MTGWRAAWLYLVSICLSASVMAQSFDNFDGGTLEEFEIEPGALQDIEVPSLSDEDGLLTGPDIILMPTESNPDSGFVGLPGTSSPITSVSQPETQQAGRVTLRALDKTLGRPTDVNMAVGETVMFGRIAIQLVECRFPAADPSSDSYAHLEIFDLEGNALFDGWMVASSPALNALEHPRYDIWVLRCDGAV